jgi:catechol 2,3-dioxygenase-like lactoylglutathione lyase family enzyme
MLARARPVVARCGAALASAHDGAYGPAHMRLDSVQIGVADLESGTTAYSLLLGLEPPSGSHRFQLTPGAIELVQGEEGIRSVRFVTDEGEAAPSLPATIDGLTVLIEPARTAPGAILESPVQAIDHVVIRSTDPDRAVAVWRDRLGLRLALDRVFEDRGLRLLFFRSGGITLEYATAHPPAEPGRPDRLWGVSYRVRDLASHRARLLAAGVDVSEIRVGMRPGTSVATVRSGTAGVPTLLLQVDVHEAGALGKGAAQA